MRARDRVVGIVLGILLGAGIVAAFVFYGSEQTIDSASLNSGSTHAKGGGGQGHSNPPVHTVNVTGCAPPASGAPTFDYRPGDLVRLRIVSDAACGTLELVGYGGSQDLPAGQTTMRFKAEKRGNYPLIVVASHIGVADIRVGVSPF
jgi:hypothetical protein